MSKETKVFIRHLEHERERISEFLQEIDLQVEHGAISRELGDQLIALEFEGRDPRAHLSIINRELAELRSLETNTPASSSRLDSAAPIAIVAVLALAIVWNFGAITGLFVAEQETFYAVPLGQTISGTQTIPLTITTPLTSLRVDGTITGSGTARIELVKDGVPYLVHSFTSEQGASLLSGFVIDEQGNEIPEENTLPEELADESTDESTDEAIETPQDPAPEPVVLEPSAPEPSAPVVTPPQSRARTETLDAVCVETCRLPRLQAPFSLRVTTTGDVVVELDTLLYGTSEEPLPEEEAPTTTTPVPTPNITTPQPVAPVTQEPTQGIACTQNSDCASGVCIDDRFQGELTARYCAEDRTWCVAGDTLYPAGSMLDDSVCLAGTNAAGQADATWLVIAGRGRFAIQGSDGILAAAIDKYGTMVVRGIATFSTSAGDEGWLVTDANGAARLSIGNDGALRSEGTVTTRTTPTRSGNGDFVIATTGGSDAAVITQTGTIALAGDFIHSAPIR